MALVFAVALLGGCQDPEARLEEHLRRGLEHAEAGRPREAVVEFNNALALDPNRSDIHWSLALAYRDAGEPRKAFWELQETMRLDPDHLQAKIYYSRTLSLLSSEDALNEALASADEVAERDPDNPDVHLARGRALQGLGRYDEAKQAFSRAAELAPKLGEPWVRLANVHRLLGENEEAERIYVKATKVGPGFGPFLNLAVFLASQPGREAEAEAAYRRAIDTAEGALRVNARGVFAGYLLSLGKPNEAEAVLSEGLREVPGQPQLVYTLARLHEWRGEPEKAEAVLRDAASVKPDDPRPMITLSLFRSSQGDHEGAMAAADAALDLDPTDPGARLRKAYLLAEAGYRDGDITQVARGREILEAVIESGAPNVHEALVVKGRLDLAEGRSDEAVFALRRAIDLGADSGRSHFLLGAALFARQDLAGARIELLRALALEPNRQDAKALMARVHAAGGEAELALELGEPALRQDPGDAVLRIALAQSLLDLDRADAARRLVEAVPEAQRDARLHFATARILERVGDTTAARAAYSAAAAADPNQPAILAALLELDRREGRLAESVARLAAAAEAHPTDPVIARLQGRAAMVSGDREAARASFQRAIDLDPNELQSYADLATLLASEGDREAILATYEQALERNPDDGRINLLVGMYYEQQGRVPDAMQRYEAAIRGDPTLSLAKNNLAYLIAETGGDLERALDLARDAKERLPAEPTVADTLGWVLFKKALPGAAIGYLREAERGVRPGDPLGGLIRHHLALAYEANGESERAVEVLERALGELDDGDGAPEPGWAREVRATLERLQGA